MEGLQYGCANPQILYIGLGSQIFHTHIVCTNSYHEPFN